MMKSFSRLIISDVEFDSVGGGWKAAVKVKGLRLAGNLRSEFLAVMVAAKAGAKPCLLEVDVRKYRNE
jgi:hypothetical protein